MFQYFECGGMLVGDIGVNELIVFDCSQMVHKSSNRHK